MAGDDSLAMLRCVSVAPTHNIVRQDNASSVKVFLVLLEALEHVVCLYRYTVALLFKLLAAGQPTCSSGFGLSIIVVDDRDQDDKKRSRNNRRGGTVADSFLNHFRLPLFLKSAIKPLYEACDILAQFIMCPSVKRFRTRICCHLVQAVERFFAPMMRRIIVEKSSKFSFALFVFLIPAISVRAESAPCEHVTYEHSEYTVCEVNLRRQSVRLFWKKPDGHPFGYPSALPHALGNGSRRLLFATNGGMYHPDNSPVGLYVEEGRELVRANTNAGPGNFHMRPNGVFFVAKDVAGIAETRSYIKQRPHADFATQSGPMLVIDGKVHPRFARYGGSRKYRVGVGTQDPSSVVFVVSESEVSFGDFARLFRDKLQCKNALFLDGGSATSFYSPVPKRNSNFLPLGPIIGVYGPD